MYQKTVLDNGVIITTERIPYVHSISLGIWIVTGSRDEDTSQNGIAHFIEHMFFKGTKKRTALEISKEIDSVGGMINALTGKEYTGIYVKVLDKNIDVAFDLLPDIFFNSTFDAKEINREREVIFQEIHLSEDTPDEHVQELFSKTYFKSHPLAQPILGSLKTVGSLNRKDLISFFHQNHNQPSKIIISATGNLDHHHIVQEFSKTFGTIPKQSKNSPRNSLNPTSNFSLHTKELEQVHLCLGAKGVSQDHPTRYAGYVLNTILGGNMSSRLFQEIREKKGLAYAIYSYFSSYFDAGLVTVYLGVSKKKANEAVKLVIAELNKLRDDGITDSELENTKEHLKGNTLLASESVDRRMSRLAKCEIYYNKFIPIEEILQKIDQVTSQDVKNLAQEIFDRKSLSLAALGPVTHKDLSPDLLDS
jgi:predicted Zn-dependent peptidase